MNTNQENSNLSSEKDIDKTKSILASIEKKTEKMIEMAYKNGSIMKPTMSNDTKETESKEKKTQEDVGDVLQNIMKSGADEFQQKTRRNMTYAEMRSAWG